MAVVYEVNLEVDADIADAYVAWLVPHMAEMLAIDGFLQTTLADVEHLTANERGAAAKKCMVATYVLESREALQTYFDVHAARLRGDGGLKLGIKVGELCHPTACLTNTVNTFAGKFSATRRIHTNVRSSTK
eukprot:gene8809-30551_t